MPGEGALRGIGACLVIRCECGYRNDDETKCRDRGAPSIRATSARTVTIALRDGLF